MRILLSFVVVHSFLAGVSTAQEIKPIEGIGPTGPIQIVAQGFRFTEGPAADANGRLYFSDVFGARIHRLADDGSVETWLEDSGMANGLMFRKDGSLLACQTKLGRVIAIDPATKKITPVAAEYNGKRFNTTNDLTIDSVGGVYFTDPAFGKGQQDSTAFYYVSVDGTITRMADDLLFPNGIILSPDEKTLYVLPYRTPHVMAYEVKSPGVLGTGKVLCDLASKADHADGGGDGMTVDARGNLYVTVPSIESIQVIDPDGKTLGLIPLPNRPTNCTFAGADHKTLYVTTAKVVYALPMEVKGYQSGKRK